MKSNILGSAVAVLTLACAAGAAKAATIYECTFTQTAGTGLTSENVVFAIEPETGDVMVSDPFIVHFMKTTAIAGEVKSDSAAKLTIGWHVRATDSKAQTATIAYRLSYLKKEKKAFMTATAMGYTNVDRADGKCKLSKG